ncbi:MAG TPA: hypothetical protein DDW52_18330 [Planctomycetaceae bacterium]|nr:hypothetical protein [Planctomycetaceae bacterium]
MKQVPRIRNRGPLTANQILASKDEEREVADLRSGTGWDRKLALTDPATADHDGYDGGKDYGDGAKYRYRFGYPLRCRLEKNQFDL